MGNIETKFKVQDILLGTMYNKLSDTFWFSQKKFLHLISDLTKTSVLYYQYMNIIQNMASVEIAILSCNNRDIVMRP